MERIISWSGRFALVLAGIWGCYLSYEGNHISRSIYLLLKLKERAKARLIAEKNSRTLFDLVELRSGALQVVKRDILTNRDLLETEDEEMLSYDDSASEYGSSTGVETPTFHGESRDNLKADRDQWLMNSLKTLRRIGIIAIVMHLVISTLSLLIVPPELIDVRDVLFKYLFYFEVPFGVFLIHYLFSTSFINSYSRYIALLRILMGLSVLISWAEVIYINHYVAEGAVTKILVTRLFLAFYIRHNFPFQSSQNRFVVAAADATIFLLMTFFSDLWNEQDTFHNFTFLVCLAVFSEVNNVRVWRSSLRSIQHMRHHDLILQEIEKEESVAEELMKRYQTRGYAVDFKPENLKEIDKPERWTIPGLKIGDDLVGQFVRILKLHGFIEESNETQVREIASRLLKYYNPNPYHNTCHAVSLCHTLSYFLRDGGAGKYFSRDEQVVLLFAGLAHDAGHPGRNNSYLIRTGSTLVQKYGMASILEKYHYDKFVEAVGTMEGLGVVQGEVEKLKKLAFRAVVATDTATYAKTLRKFQKSERELMTKDPSEKAKEVLGQMLMISADVANVSYDTTTSEMWLVRLLNEFYLQGDMERSLGIGVSMFMDRSKNAPYNLSCGFIDAVAGKMIRELANILNIDDFVHQMDKNRVIFEKKKRIETGDVPGK